MADEANPYDAYDDVVKEAEEIVDDQAAEQKQEDLAPPDTVVEEPKPTQTQGFGAEREQLEQEYIALPEEKKEEKEQEVEPPAENKSGRGGEHNQADKKVQEASDRVLQLLVPEIYALNQQFEALTNFNEDSNADSQSKWTVSNPIKMEDTSGLKIGSVVKYTVQGVDSQGPIEVQRRYNEFLALNKALNESWPGCYIPCIPDAQFIGNKDEGFVEERRQLLERFCQECSKYNFIIESREFQIFTHEGGEVTERLEKIPKQTPGQILEKFRQNFPKIQEESPNDMAAFRERISIFSNFLSKCQQANMQNREAMMNSVKNHGQHNNDYKQLYSLFMQYEQSAIEYFSENEISARTLTHPKAGELSENINTQVQLFKNPFLEAAVWIKGEMLDIAGMLNAMKGRDIVMKKQLATEGRKRDDQQELEKLSLGKTTLKSFFKSKSGKEQDILRLQADIERANVEIEEYRKLISFIVVYQGHFAIEKFKKDKIAQYNKMLHLMSIKSVHNMNLYAQLSKQILELQAQ